MKLILLPLLLYFVSVQCYKTIIDVLSEDSKFSTLIMHLQYTRLIPMINNLEGGTFFAPENSAFECCGREDITREVLLYHLLPRKYISSELEEGQVIETSYVRPGFLGKDPIGQKVKISEKFGTFYRVNEAIVKERDIFVNYNTTINVINRVLEPPPFVSSVVKHLDGKLYELMVRTEVDKLLSKKRPFTTFISAKYLLDRFNQVENKYLISPYGFDDLKQMIQYLVISEPVYFDSLEPGETSYTSESGEKIQIKITANHKQATVNGIKVLKKDILAANGVLHVLDDLPFADSIVFDTRKYLLGLNATKFVGLIDQYDLGHYLDPYSSNITILAPTNEVIDEDDIPNNLKKQWLSYHLIQGAWKPTDLLDRTLLKTEYFSSLLYNQSQRMVVRVGKRDERSLKSIQFGSHSKVIGKDMSINGNIIYRISDPVDLPPDIFTRLVVDLELSTFIATLYVSGVIEDIKQSKAITLFVPTNQAYKNLGLVSRYLTSSAGKSDLQTVLRYHVASSVLYYQDLLDNILEVTTLSDESLIIDGKNNEGKIWIRAPNEDLTEREEYGVLQKSDMLISNGVIHKVDHIQIPNHVNITHHNLLSGINANLMQDILKRTGVLDEMDFEKEDYYILAPTDKAFDTINLEKLFDDQDRLKKIARLHVVPKSTGKKRWFFNPFFGEQEFGTLLEQDKIVVRQVGKSNMMIKVKGQPYSEHARVLDMGRVSTGDRTGGVLEIDSVLFPVERGAFGLPWIWSALIIGLLWIASFILLILAGFIVFKKYKRSRDGYAAIIEAEADDIAEEERSLLRPQSIRE